METLATRVGRFESELEALRREVSQLQGQSSSDARSGSGVQASELQLQWVRLFEKELEQLRRQAESYKEPIAVLEERLTRLERVASPESGRDLDELAELVLTELQALKQKVYQLAAPKRQGVALHGGGAPPMPQLTNAGASGQGRSPAGAALARVEQLQRLEQSTASLEERLQRLEKEVSPVEGSPGDGSQLQKRLQHLEDEVQIGMQPLKRHQVSLQVLEETSMKVEKLQETLKLLPLDLALQRSEDAFKALEDAAHRSTGQMSLLDGYKVQSSLDQLYSAMEALVRQRSADVQLVNSYLGEVYQRIERDLPSDKGQGIIQSLEQLQNQHQLLKAECRALTDVRIPELEAKLSHEASAAAVLAQGNRQQIIKLEVATQEAVNQLTATQARLPALQDATERRAVQDGRREALVAELRKELMHLKQDFAQFTTDGSLEVGGGIGEKFHASLSAMQATLMARIEKEAKDSRSIQDTLAAQMQSLQDRLHNAEMTGSSANTFMTDLQMLAQDFAALRSESARADVELRERVTRGERELKAEIRAAQRLLLEVAESARHISPERLTASQMAVKAAAPKADAPVGPGPPLPALPGFGTGGSSSVLEDVGTLTAHDDIVEWNVPGVRARARLGTAHPLISEAFEMHRFPDVKALRLKIFPLGSRRRTKPGHCSVYLTGPQGTHLQFMLRMGSVEHGPLECIFDRPEKDSGRHDFCALEDELEVDGSAAVRLPVLRADFVPT